MVLVKAVSKSEGEFYARNSRSSRKVAIDVSGYAKDISQFLSPYTFSRDFKLTVPGMEGEIAHSVEGVWQGLKVVNGEINPRLFRKRPKKRKGFVEGHMLGGEIIDIIKAREQIYIPTYFEYLGMCDQANQAIDEILSIQQTGREVLLYDTEENIDLQNSNPLAHSTPLALYINLTRNQIALEPRNEGEEQLYEILDGDGTIEDKVASIVPLIEKPNIRKSLYNRCFEHPHSIDDWSVGRAFRFFI